MHRVKLVVSPLFWVLAVVMTVVGKGMTMAAYVFSLVLHELAHASVAARYGYRLNCIRLAPYGAMIDGEQGALPAEAELRIALAGPICSIVIASLSFCASKILPIASEFFAPITEANVCLGLCNLIPVSPLDGGRALSAWCSARLHTVAATRVVTRVGVAVACVFVVAACVGVFFGVSISVAVFAVFMLIGAWTGAKGALYARLTDATALAQALPRGIPIACYAVAEDMTAARALTLADGKRLAVFVLCDQALAQIGILTEIDVRRVATETGASIALCEIYAKLHTDGKA